MNVNDHTYGGVNNDFGGALNVNASSPTSVVDIDNCTFAYNLTDSTKASSRTPFQLSVRNADFRDGWRHAILVVRRKERNRLRG